MPELSSNSTLRTSINETVPYITKTFGSIGTLKNIVTGNNYQEIPTVRVRDFILSNNLQGRVYYSNSSPVITGEDTSFTVDFNVGDYIRLTDSSQKEHRIVVEVSNNTSMVLDDNPYFTSNGHVSDINIINSGSNYSNNDTISVNGSGHDALFSLKTNSNGAIVAINNITSGSGYRDNTTITIISANGSGAILSATVAYSTYQLAIPLALANYSRTDNSPSVLAANGSVNGMNERVIANPIYGTGIVKSVQSKNSGFGYHSGEYVSFAAFGAIDDIQIVSGGRNYSNGQSLVFSGGSPSNQAQGKVITDANGTITSVTYTKGSGYKTVPDIRIVSSNGRDAVFKTSIGGINTDFLVTGYVNTSGTGKLRGFWTSTKSFLSADKYLQDSYYYQEYSYEIQSSLSFDTYFSLMKNLFHTAGTELFGKTVKSDNIVSKVDIVWEEVNDVYDITDSSLDYSNNNNTIYHYVIGT